MQILAKNPPPNPLVLREGESKESLPLREGFRVGYKIRKGEGIKRIATHKGGIKRKGGRNLVI